MQKASNSKLVSELVKIFLLNEEELIKLHKVGKKLPKKKPHQSRYCEGFSNDHEVSFRSQLSAA